MTIHSSTDPFRSKAPLSVLQKACLKALEANPSKVTPAQIQDHVQLGKQLAPSTSVDSATNTPLIEGKKQLQETAAQSLETSHTAAIASLDSLIAHPLSQALLQGYGSSLIQQKYQGTLEPLEKTALQIAGPQQAPPQKPATSQALTTQKPLSREVPSTFNTLPQLRDLPPLSFLDQDGDGWFGYQDIVRVAQDQMPVEVQKSCAILYNTLNDLNGPGTRREGESVYWSSQTYNDFQQAIKHLNGAPRNPMAPGHIDQLEKAISDNHQEILENLTTPPSTPIAQQEIGECWLLSSLIAEQPQDLSHLVTPLGEDRFQVSLEGGSVQKEVSVNWFDKAIGARSHNDDLQALEVATREHLLEVQPKTGKDPLFSQPATLGLELLTGKKAQQLYRLDPQEIGNPEGYSQLDTSDIKATGELLAQLQQEERAVVVSMTQAPSPQLSTRLTSHHGYALLGFDHKEQRVILANPHAKDARDLDGQQDGVFSLSLQEFCANFDLITHAEKSSPTN